MALPLVALWGVENEQVVRDIAAACRGDYSYLHRTLNSLDGMDFALLYYGDLFYPTRDDAATSTSRANSDATPWGWRCAATHAWPNGSCATCVRSVRT